MIRQYYIYLLHLDGQDLHTLWCTNDFDCIHINEDGKISAFRVASDLISYANRLGIVIQPDEPATLNLDLIQDWLRKPTANIDPVTFLNAWNLLTDVRSGINQRNMDREDKQHLGLYGKLFCGNNLPTITPPGEHYTPIWSNAEVEELYCLLAPALSEFRDLLAIN